MNENAKMAIDTVIFDFDGTVMDTNGLIMSSWLHAFREIAGKDGSEEEIRGSFGEPLEDTAAKFFPGYDTAEVVRVYRAYHAERYFEAIRLFPGMLELLERLKSDGYALGLVTARQRHTTQIGFDKYRLDRFFDALVAVEDTENPKPAPDPILLCLNILGKAPGRSIMVGDTKHDIQSARAAGLPSVLVGWSVAVPPDDRSGPDGPDFVIDSPDGLLDIINRMECKEVQNVQKDFDPRRRGPRIDRSEKDG